MRNNVAPLPFPAPPQPLTRCCLLCWISLSGMRIPGAINAHGKFWKIDLNDQRDTSWRGVSANCNNAHFALRNSL